MLHKLSSSFNAGELSPLMDSRVSVEKYESGCRRLRNFILHTHGPVYRRPGMEYLGEQMDRDKASRFIEFNFSAETTFMIEMGEGAFRFWSNGILMLKAGLPYEVTNPFLPDEFFKVQVKQINDVLYMCHPNHWPQKLSRLADDNWVSERMPVIYPPLLDDFVEKSTASPTSPTVEVTQEWAINANSMYTWINPPTNYNAGMRVKVYVHSINPAWPRNLKSRLELQILNGSTWVLIKRWTGWSNPQTFKNGYLFDAPGFNAKYRLVYAQGEGNAFTEFAGVMGIQWVTPPVPTIITLSSSHIAVGQTTLLTANIALFKTGADGKGSHNNAYWEIVHRRELSSSEVVGATGTEGAPGAITGAGSTPIRIVGRWDVYTYGTWNGTLLLEQETSTPGDWEVVRSWKSKYDRNVVANGLNDVDVNMRLRVVSGLGIAASGAASPRFLLEAADARTYGLVKITSVQSATAAYATVIRALEATGETKLWAEGAWSDVRGYPEAIGLYEQRIWFGGTRSNPQSLWASVTGDFENFRRSTADDGSIFRTLAAESSNSIRWISSASALLVGTGAEVWAIMASQDGQPITPISMNAVRQSGYSSNSVPAKLAHEVTLFVQRDGRRLRQLSYTEAQQSYTAADLTVLAPHVTEGGIKQLAFQQSPTAIVWCVTANGKLAGMTFEREQNVFGWHVHETDGEIETIAVLQGTPADEVWLGVKRTINGETRRSVERLSPRGMRQDFSDVAQLGYSDAFVFRDHGGHTYDSEGAATDGESPATEIDGVEQEAGRRSVIEGLQHLEGKEVVILADGVVQPPRIVTGGKIQIQDRARIVIVGLAYESVLQPMKQEVAMDDGTAQGRRFKLNGVTVRVTDSQGGEVSANPEDKTLRWEPLRKREVVVPVDSAPRLFTGERDLLLESRHEAAVNVTVRTTEPLPLNVTGLIFKFDVYGV